LTGGRLRFPGGSIGGRQFKETRCAKKPANVLSEGSRRASESSILFSSESDFTGG
jgi:hypothetical protein